MIRFRSSLTVVILIDAFLGVCAFTLVTVSGSLTFEASWILLLCIGLLSYYHFVVQLNDIIVHSSRIEIYNVFRIWSPRKYFDFNSIRIVSIRGDKSMPFLEIYTKDFGMHGFVCFGVSSKALSVLYEILKKKHVEVELRLKD